METTPSEPQPSASSSEAWDKLSQLNRMIIEQPYRPWDLYINPTPEPVSGAPPTVLALATEIDNAKKEFDAFTFRAVELETAINRGDVVANEDIGHALDTARAWVEYFGPNGPLWRGFPASTAAQVYVDALTRVNQLQRVAQQWVDYFNQLWEKRWSSQQERAQDEEECLQRAAQAEQTVSQRRMSFTLNSSSLSSQQMQGYIQELNNLLAEVDTWLAASNGPACRQRLQVLIQSITSALELFRFSYRSRLAFEDFLRQQGRLPPI